MKFLKSGCLPQTLFFANCKNDNIITDLKLFQRRNEMKDKWDLADCSELWMLSS